MNNPSTRVSFIAKNMEEAFQALNLITLPASIQSNVSLGTIRESKVAFTPEEFEDICYTFLMTSPVREVRIEQLYGAWNHLTERDVTRKGLEKSVQELRDEVKQIKEIYESAASSDPIPMILYCPDCNTQHIDDGEWKIKHHRSHECQFCGYIWRPADIATVGVSEIKTKGKNDSDVISYRQFYQKKLIEAAFGAIESLKTLRLSNQFWTLMIDGTIKRLEEALDGLKEKNEKNSSL